MARLNLVDEDSSAVEAFLVKGSLEDLLRVARATAQVEAEEAEAAESKRPTVPIFDGEPWT